MIDKYVQCRCGNELLQISKDVDKDIRTGREFEIYFFSMYSHGLNWDERYTFWNRIKYCWHVLKTGRPWADCMTLKKTDVEKIVTDLQELIKEEVKDDVI